MEGIKKQRSEEPEDNMKFCCREYETLPTPSTTSEQKITTNCQNKIDSKVSLFPVEHENGFMREKCATHLKKHILDN